uniref:Uncharacterized protein n=1 Tax=Branchiostoma floridae TaxID=7739 RepID=C3YDP8_BRAFL|eukprot:XP_002605507.1 hypothetical protein BRAFLDRAFT_126805 [Branchiostoma floridae]
MAFPFGDDFLNDKDFGKILKKKRRQPPKLWRVQDVVGEEDREGQLWENPELEAYLHHYREATTLGRGGAQEAEDIQLQYLRTAIDTSLGKGTHKAGQYASAASLTLPFPRKEFDKHFRPLKIVGWQAGVSGQPETFSCLPQELTPLLGRGWHRKPLKSSSAILIKRVGVTWRYKPVVRYDHTGCARCTYKGPEKNRPPKCSPKAIILSVSIIIPLLPIFLLLLPLLPIFLLLLPFILRFC